MGLIRDLGRYAWRKHETDGNTATPLNQPQKTDIIPFVDAVDAEVSRIEGIVAAGDQKKSPVKVLVTVATAPAAMTAGSTHDGVVIAAGESLAVAVPGGSNGSGIFEFQPTGPAIRRSDADTGAELARASFTVDAGSNLGSTWFVENTEITIGATAIVIKKVANAPAVSGEVVTARQGQPNLAANLDTIRAGVASQGWEEITPASPFFLAQQRVVDTVGKYRITKAIRRDNGKEIVFNSTTSLSKLKWAVDNMEWQPAPTSKYFSHYICVPDTKGKMRVSRARKRADGAVIDFETVRQKLAATTNSAPAPEVDVAASGNWPVLGTNSAILEPNLTDLLSILPVSLLGFGLDNQGRGPNYAQRFRYPYTPRSIQSWHGKHLVRTQSGHVYHMSVSTQQEETGLHKMRLATQYLNYETGLATIIRHGTDWADDDHDKAIKHPILDRDGTIGLSGVIIYGGHNELTDYLEIQFCSNEDARNASKPLRIAGPRSTYAYACQHPVQQNLLYVLTRINTNGQWMLTVVDLILRQVAWQAMCMDSVVPQLYFDPFDQIDQFGIRFTCYPNPAQQTTHNYLVTAVLDWDGQWHVDDPAIPNAYVPVPNANIRTWTTMLDPLAFGRKLYQAPAGWVIRQCEAAEWSQGKITAYLCRSPDGDNTGGTNINHPCQQFTLDIDLGARMESPYVPGLQIPAVTETLMTADGGITIRSPATSNPSYWAGNGGGGNANRAISAVYSGTELPDKTILALYNRAAVGAPWVRSEIICVRDKFIARPQSGRYHYRSGVYQRSRPDHLSSVWIGSRYNGFAANTGVSQIVDLSF
ncbi:hypothetical protein [Oryzicola mucosus]|uniref:Uncharacterized protein n=1 Tax=Oryzicola mucosus TaxID=2767425 RepID=A0A8J6PQ34_9HYPH|nr:hypothetical protein [Oryzicola mucosus]MBD0416497.1 hypothetical protein [Oryzicola mucosus]